MIKPIDEACIGWLHENYYLGRWIFLVWKMSIFMLQGGILPPSTGFADTYHLGEGVGQHIDGGGNKKDESRGNIFDKMDNTGGII